jgi:glycosyltransferase involved in cell wall biosynthesis
MRASDVVVGALELEATYFAWMCGRLLRRPVIGWVHAVMDEHLKELQAVHTHLAKLVYPRLDRLVVPSRGAADSLARVAALDRERINVIPSSVDVPLLAMRAAEPLPEWAVPVFEKPTLLAVGRLVPSKGFDVLLHAHARVRRDGIDHHLAIVGEGPMRDELEHLAVRLGVRGSVYLPGFSPNPWPLMKAADALILPSWFEGLSLVLLEALAVGTPVVATDCPGGPSDLLDHGRYGWLVPPRDVEGLALAVARLLRDPAQRDAMRTAGPARAREFGSERVLPLWESVLGSVG